MRFPEKIKDIRCKSLLSQTDFAKELGIKKNYRGRTDLAYTIDGKHKCPFGRVLIRRKKNGNK